MKAGKIGCFFIYSIFLIVVGMGLYKYREDVLAYLGVKYNESVEYIKARLGPKLNDVPKISIDK